MLKNYSTANNAIRFGNGPVKAIILYTMATSQRMD